MFEQAKMHMANAYNHMRALTVSHDNVKQVALAEQEMEEAFRVLEELEKTVKEEQSDGQTD